MWVASVVVSVWALACRALGAISGSGPPVRFAPQGISGGGAFFNPAFHPTDPLTMAATTDMSAVFRSGDGGGTWETLPFTTIGGGRPTQVSFCAGDRVYAIDCRGPTADAPTGRYASVSNDRGHTFAPINGTPVGGGAVSLHVDPTGDGRRLVLADATTVHVSADGGATWATVANHTEGLRVAGEPLFSASGWTVVAIAQGVVAIDPAARSPSFVPWANASEGVAAFAAAEDPDTGGVTAVAITAPPSVLAAGSEMMVEELMTSSLAVYAADIKPFASSPRNRGAPAAAGWRRLAGVPPLVGDGGALGVTHVRMAPGDPGSVYLAGQCQGDCPYASATGGYPFVVRARRDGGSGGGWAPAEHLLRGNINTRTGWEGSWGDGLDGYGWSWGGGALSFAVAGAAAGVGSAGAGFDSTPGGGRGDVNSNGPHRLAFTDDGFLHASFDGGATWDALYVTPPERNAPGARAPSTPSWAGNGLMDQSSHHVAWADASRVFAAYTDIRGTVSGDGGRTWSFNYTGHSLNTMYRIETVPAGVADGDQHAGAVGAAEKKQHTGAVGVTGVVLYAATSSVHDMYQSTHLTDKTIDKGDGRVLASDDSGVTWHTVCDLAMPAVWAAKDPSRPRRLYYAGVHSTRGGIFVADGVAGTAPAAFRKLPNPPRTQGHPYAVAPLPDGALVVTYSGRMDDQRHTFFNSSGVFYLPANAPCLAPGAPLSAPCPWVDRSADAMWYWTKELVVDPLDPTGDTWFVAVFTEWGATRVPGRPTRGGLYRTTDRGRTWSPRLDGVPYDGDDWAQARIESVTIVTSSTPTPMTPTAQVAERGPPSSLLGAPSPHREQRPSLAVALGRPGESGPSAGVYMTTEGAGLWHSAYDRCAPDGGLRFTRVASYPFSHPTRVVVNPHNASELWVTSFGNGLHVGAAQQPGPSARVAT